MSEAESTVERVTQKGRRVLFVLAAFFLIIAGGGIAIALLYNPLWAVGYVVVLAFIASALFPRLV